MRLRPLALLIGLATPLLFSGCDTVGYRVLTNYGAYSKLDPNVRATIFRGRVDVGFTREMTLLALGRPDNSYRPNNGSGRIEIWTYYALPLSSGDGDTGANGASQLPSVFWGSVTLTDNRVSSVTPRFAAR